MVVRPSSTPLNRSQVNIKEERERERERERESESESESKSESESESESERERDLHSFQAKGLTPVRCDDATCEN